MSNVQNMLNLLILSPYFDSFAHEYDYLEKHFKEEDPSKIWEAMELKLKLDGYDPDGQIEMPLYVSYKKESYERRKENSDI